MTTLAGIVRGLGALNSALLTVSRNIAWVLLVAMVAIIVLQVVYRYIPWLDAFSWTEEAARSLMIWMMALIGPTAYRWGGFVSIDMFKDALPRPWSNILNLVLMLIATGVLWFLLTNAWNHFNSGFLFNASGLNRLLQDSGINQTLGTNMQFKLAWIYLAMTVCFTLMLLVNIELVLREIGRIFYDDESFPDPQPHGVMSAE